MGASFAAELLKLRKRPATWVLGLVWLALSLFFGYALPYAIYLATRGIDAGQAPTGFDPGIILRETLPDRLVPNLVSGFPTFGGAIALILGALVAGSEYGWGTLKTMLTQRPQRLGVYAGKLLALGVVLAAIIVPVFLLGALCSYGIASIEGSAAAWPSLLDVAKGLGAAWLIFAMWAALGVLLGTLTRGTALAIGLGLVWALVVESLVGGFAPLWDVLANIQKALPGQNAGSLAASLGSATQGDQGAPGVVSAVSGAQATWVLLLYLAAFLVLGGLLLRRRDVA